MENRTIPDEIRQIGMRVSEIMKWGSKTVPSNQSKIIQTPARECFNEKLLKYARQLP